MFLVLNPEEAYGDLDDPHELTKECEALPVVVKCVWPHQENGCCYVVITGKQGDGDFPKLHPKGVASHQVLGNIVGIGHQLHFGLSFTVADILGIVDSLVKGIMRIHVSLNDSQESPGFHVGAQPVPEVLNPLFLLGDGHLVEGDSPDR